MKQVAVEIKVALPRVLLRRSQAQLNQEKASPCLQHMERDRSHMRSPLRWHLHPCTIDCSTYR
jgi:hypothetical protein